MKNELNIFTRNKQINLQSRKIIIDISYSIQNWMWIYSVCVFLYDPGVRILNSDDGVQFFVSWIYFENRECLFYSSLIPTTSKNDNFYIVCLWPCVCALLYIYSYMDSCVREWGPKFCWILAYVFVTLCVSATDVAICRCIVVLCFRYKISTQERECDKYDNITDIFLCCWPYSIENSLLYTTAVVAGLNYMATPPIFSCCFSALSFSVYNIVVAILFFFFISTSASHDLEFSLSK